MGNWTITGTCIRYPIFYCGLSRKRWKTFLWATIRIQSNLIEVLSTQVIFYTTISQLCPIEQFPKRSRILELILTRIFTRILTYSESSTQPLQVGLAFFFIKLYHFPLSFRCEIRFITVLMSSYKYVRSHTDPLAPMITPCPLRTGSLQAAQQLSLSLFPNRIIPREGWLWYHTISVGLWWCIQVSTEDEKIVKAQVPVLKTIQGVCASLLHTCIGLYTYMYSLFVFT